MSTFEKLIEEAINTHLQFGDYPTTEEVADFIAIKLIKGEIIA